MFYKKLGTTIGYILIMLFSLCHVWLFNMSLIDIENNTVAFLIRIVLIAGYTIIFMGIIECFVKSNINIKKLLIISSGITAIFLTVVAIENIGSYVYIISAENYIGIKGFLLIDKSQIFYIACLLFNVFMIIISKNLQKELSKKNIILSAIIIFLNVIMMILIFTKYSYYIIALLCIEMIGLLISLYIEKRNKKTDHVKFNSLAYIAIPLCLIITTAAMFYRDSKGLYIMNILLFIYVGVKITGNKYSEFKSLQHIYNFAFLYLCISLFDKLIDVGNPIFYNLNCVVTMLTLLVMCQIQNIKIIRIKSMRNILYKNIANVVKEYAGKTVKVDEYMYYALTYCLEIECDGNIDELICYYAGSYEKDGQQYEMFITYDLKDTKFLLLKKVSETSYTITEDENLIKNAIDIFDENLQYGLVKSKILTSEEDIIIMASFV